MPAAWAEIGAAVIGAGGAIISSNNAADAQQHAVDSANDLQKYEYDQTRADQQPYRDLGYSALGRMGDLLGLSGNTSAAGYGSLMKPLSVGDVENDPGYQFELNQGLKTAQNSAAARGGLYSGATLKALTQYGNDYAGTKYNEAYSRAKNEQDTLYNRLAGISGTGQTATTAVDTAGQNYATQAGGNLIGAGNARGAADIATGNAIGNAANQGAAWWMHSQPGQNPYWSGTPTQYQMPGDHWGSSFGSAGEDQFFYGNGTSGD